MQRPPFPDNEAQRMAALRSLDVLFTPSEERFDRITRLASRLLGTPIALVSLIADKCQWFKSAQGLDATETSREISFCGHAILSEQTFVVEDTKHDPRFSDNPLVLAAPNIRFYAGHPLHTVDGSRVGTLCVIDRHPRRFTTEQLQVLRDLAALAETELQRGQLSEAQRDLVRERDELKLKASIDGLTRLWNRGAIMELLGAELARAKRGVPMCIAMVDADRFKDVNDNHGHQAGDAVLVELAERVRRAVREFDAVGRYGGEEFIAVLNNCNLEAAKTVCERILRFIANEPIETPVGPLTVTVSIGLAACDSAHDDPERILGAADAALYRAKDNGRNRVEIEGAPTQPLTL
jgi:diguanylate cyclase (GGDEF)-like protein